MGKVTLQESVAKSTTLEFSDGKRTLRVWSKDDDNINLAEALSEQGVTNDYADSANAPGPREGKQIGPDRGPTAEGATTDVAQYRNRPGPTGGTVKSMDVEKGKYRKKEYIGVTSSGRGVPRSHAGFDTDDGSMDDHYEAAKLHRKEALKAARAGDDYTTHWHLQAHHLHMLEATNQSTDRRHLAALHMAQAHAHEAWRQNSEQGNPLGI